MAILPKQHLGAVASLVLGGALSVPTACDPRDTPQSTPPAASSVPLTSQATIGSASTTTPIVSKPVVLMAGGDIDLSRRTGKRILREPTLDPFRSIRPLLTSADLRFANLESPLCEMGGRPNPTHNPLVFAGPPSAADVLARGDFDVVSTANNHAWDFGRTCLTETVANLRRVGIRHVGTDPSGADPLRAQVLERHGQRLAFFAMTGIFNDGALRHHKAKAYLADADIGELKRRIERIRPTVDWIVVSMHIGEEYSNVPIQATQYALYNVVEAGADIVLGHHTHTPQRIDFFRGRPVIHSFGNFVFHQHSGHPWTGWGYLVRVTFTKPRERSAGQPAVGGGSARDPNRADQPNGGGSASGGSDQREPEWTTVHGGRRARRNAARSQRRGRSPLIVELCPYHLFDAAPQPLTKAQERAFFAHWDVISKAPNAARRGARSEDGCVAMVRRAR